MQLHEIYGWQMKASQALALLRRTGQAQRLEVRHLLSVLDSGREVIPASLAPLCERVYLMQVAPANRLPA
jgi:hypothetical protein